MTPARQLRSALVSQFHRPHGALGRVAGWILELRPSNRERNQWTVELLDIQPTDRVLELGFGPGLSIEAASKRATAGVVVGLDHSETMVAMARKRNRGAVDRGAVILECGSFEDLHRLGEDFDKIFAVNALQFASDTDHVLATLIELLTPGGVFATTFQSRRAGATDDDARSLGVERAESFARLGLEDVQVEVLPLRPVCAVCVMGRSAKGQPSGP